MSEYINRDDALNCFHDWVDKHGNVFCADDTAEYIEIENLPSIDVVRCKDCKWSDWYTTADGHIYCYCMETGNGGRTENDYCSYGERGEADDE